MALHEQSVGATDEWYTPPYVFDALGCRFDMDVAHPGAHIVDWVPAGRLSVPGADLEWEGFLWMNPPFGARNGLVPWLERFFAHANGIALVPDRTSAPWWQLFVPRADAVLFVAPKIRFVRPDGSAGKSPAQGTTLLACGQRAVEVLVHAEHCGLGRVFLPRGIEWTT